MLLQVVTRKLRPDNTSSAVTYYVWTSKPRYYKIPDKLPWFEVKVKTTDTFILSFRANTHCQRCNRVTKYSNTSLMINVNGV